MSTRQWAFVGGACAIAAALFVVFGMPRVVTNPLAPGGPGACTADAKICPDGTAVGRIPPACEFAACPDAGSGGEVPVPGRKVSIMARVGMPVEALGETVIVRKVLEDSRCPVDVQCIWAGTVRLDVTVRGGMGDGQLTLSLGDTGSSEINTFALVGVSPAPQSGVDIAEGDYHFVIEVASRPD